MAVGKEDRGPLWVDGRFTVRVRGPGLDPGRIVRLRRPYAVIGRRPEAEIRIDDPAVEDHHAFLLLDRRGVFGVDLLTRTGTRFAGAAATSARLGPGDILEVAGRRIEILQLRVDGSVIDPPLSDDDPLAEADASTLAALTLEPLDVPGRPGCSAWPWSSSAGARPASGSRGPRHSHSLRVAPRPVHRPRDRPRRSPDAPRRPAGQRGLGPPDGAILTVGQARFTSGSSRLGARPAPDDRPDRREPQDLTSGLPAELAGNPQAALLALMLTGASREPGEPQAQVLETLRMFQSDAATLFEAQLDRIEALGREIATLRDEIRGSPPRRTGPPSRSGSTSPPASRPIRSNPPPGSSSRLNGLESESRSTWKDLIARIASSVGLRAPSGPHAGRQILKSPRMPLASLRGRDVGSSHPIPGSCSRGTPGPFPAHPRRRSPPTQTPDGESHPRPRPRVCGDISRPPP